MSLKKHIQTIQNALIFGVTLFITLGVLSIGYSAFISSYPATVGTGSGLSSTQWNKMVSGLQTLDTNLSNFSFSSGNVGIGTASPAGNLHINSTTTNATNLLYVTPTGGTFTNSNGILIDVSGVASNGATFIHGRTAGGATEWFYVLTNGDANFAGSVTATNFTSPTGWTAIPAASGWTSYATCRKIWSFLQINGYVTISATTPVWGSYAATLPAACRPSMATSYPPAICWNGSSSVTPCFSSIDGSTGNISIFAASILSAFSFAGTYPAN